MPNPPTDYDALGALLRTAGGAARECFGRAQTRRKRDGTVVTEADIAAEAILVEGLRARWPGDGLCGEEGARRDAGASDGIWYIDPIDGTASYVEGLAYWGSAVARVDSAGIEVGAFYLPRLDELWFARRGEGAWRDRERLQPLVDAEPDRHGVIFLPSRFHQWGRVDHPGKARNLGSIAAHLCLLAGGAAQGTFIPPGWRLWDVLAGLLLLEEVGGVALKLDGTPLRPLEDTREPFVAGTETTCRFLLGPRGIRARQSP